jgi:hypothetical protein
MRSFLMAALVALPATALAQPVKAADVSTMVSDDCAKARKAGKTCVLTIEDEDVTGGVPTHEGIGTGFITFGDHNSLIKIRRDFITEILRTAEDID